MSTTDGERNNNAQNRAKKCPYCQRRFETLDDLTLHIVTRHTQAGISRGPAQAGGSK